MNYLTLQEFLARFEPLAAIVGGERKQKLARDALRHAHAHLDAQLAKRYPTPLPLVALPSDAQEIVRRWVFYLAVRELLAMQNIVINKDELSILADAFELVDEQIREYTEGSRVLPNAGARSRIVFGFASLMERR